MGIISNNLYKKKNTVFGTQNYQYDTTEFDRLRDDGVSIIDLLPECRVFIAGADVTKDVMTTSITHKLGGSECSITLANPRGKYELSKQDLTGRWREDKDILAVYDYDYFNKDKGFDPLKILKSQQLYDTATNTLTGVTNPTIGAVGGALAQKAANTILDGVTQPYKHIGHTRMLFEVKHVSGLQKRVGDIVFDYKDPVYVFLKGRFSPMWYFGFSGIITTWDEADAYGSDSTISFNCSDIFYLLKKSKLQERGAIYPAGNFETSIVNPSKKARLSLFDKKTAWPLSDLFKMVLFGDDYADQVQNSHISSVFVSPEGYEDPSNAEQGLSAIKSRFPGFKDTFCFTEKQVDLATDNVCSLTGGAVGPNAMYLSHWQQAYFQHNQINMVGYDNLQKYYAESVRYWEAQHKISTSAPDPKKMKSGWGDNKAFGVMGIHPALKYEFLDNFAILPNIWNEIKNYATKPGEAVSNLVISPYDKIVESIVGSATEDRTDINTPGTNLNVFRPRAFLVLPKRYSTDHPVEVNALGSFSLLKESATTVYEGLTRGLASLDYVSYISPMGDLFVEPTWYDTHPLNNTQLDYKDVLRNSTVETATVRVPSSYSSEFLKAASEIKAYDYNDNNNHPFFFMEKDRFRFTQAFSPENIKTKVIVRGGFAKEGKMSSVVESAISTDDMNTFALFNQGSTTDSKITTGIFVAHGFTEKFIFTMKRFAQLQTTVQAGKNKAYQDSVYKAFFADSAMRDCTIEQFITYYGLRTIEQQSQAIKDYKNDRGKYPVQVINENLRSVLNVVINDDYFSYFVAPDSEEAPKQTPWVLGNSTTFTDNSLVLLQQVLPSLYTALHATYSSKKKLAVQVSTKGVSGITLNTRIATLLNCLTDSVSGSQITYDTFVNHNKTASNPYFAELAKMYEFYLIYNNAITDSELTSKQIEATRLLQQIMTLESSGNTVMNNVKTIADFQALAKMGFYNPRMDMMRMYGYNPSAVEITNTYVASGREAQFYATVIFQKLLSEAYTFNLDVVQRPECQLNRTYYCQRKDAIGLLTQFSLKWGYGEEAISTIALTNIRKNVASYNYVLPEGLNLLVEGQKTDNAFFTEKAETYFKWKKFSQLVSDLASSGLGNLATGLASGAMGGTIGGVIGDEIKGITAATIKNLNFGGLYSIHDYIGHIDYDKASVQMPIKDVVSAAASDLADNAVSMKKIYEKFFITDASASGNDTSGLSINYVMLNELMAAINTIHLNMASQFSQYMETRTRLQGLQNKAKANTALAAKPFNIKWTTAEKQSWKDAKAQLTEQKTKESVISKTEETFDMYLTQLFGAASGLTSNYAVGGSVDTYANLINSSAKPGDKTQTIGQILKTVPALTYDNVGKDASCLYAKVQEWLPKTKDTQLWMPIVDPVDAENNPQNFGSYGTIRSFYYRSST